MPSKSLAQHRLMEAVAHDPKFAAKAGIPERVGQDFIMADMGRKIAKAAATKSKEKRK